MALGADLERAWSHPAATAATRKRILRAAIAEIIVRRDGAIIQAVLHWQAGDHTELQVKQRLNAAGRHNPRIPDDMIALMRELARLMPDRQIARLLNRIGVETGRGNAWTQERVRGFRNHHEIAATHASRSRPPLPCRVVVGSSGSRSGNSHVVGWPTHHHSRSNCRIRGDSMPLRSFLPLPCLDPEHLSMSDTFRLETSETRKPAP
jgi:hypothetical protein